ncbi:MAG: YnbE family lipoprotein [Alphaproteobacteria bacterium]|nr:YnbE family lipoprotein [Alphaproteobacteria bacterium]
MHINTLFLGLIAIFSVLLIACTPTVKVEAPDKPIDVNMNVNIKHKIKVTKVDPNKNKPMVEGQEA